MRPTIYIVDPSNAGYLGDPNSTRWPFDNSLAANLIPVSYRQYSADNGASADALLNRAINGSEIKSDGALYWLAADIVDATWSQTFAIRGGNDRAFQRHSRAPSARWSSTAVP